MVCWVEEIHIYAWFVCCEDVRNECWQKEKKTGSHVEHCTTRWKLERTESCGSHLKERNRHG